MLASGLLCAEHITKEDLFDLFGLDVRPLDSS